MILNVNVVFFYIKELGEIKKKWEKEECHILVFQYRYIIKQIKQTTDNYSLQIMFIQGLASV